MSNSTSSYAVPAVVKICVVLPLALIFLFVVSVMLRTFSSQRHFLDTCRYVLFAHMLVNDALLVSSSVVLFCLVRSHIYFPLVYCLPLLYVSAATFMNTPLILAAMSLERYVAIVYPLRRPAAWRSDRVWAIVLTLWTVSCLIPLIDFSLGKLDPRLDPFSSPVLCKTAAVNSNPIQMLLKASSTVLLFASVALIILFTYVRILVETRRMRTDGASVNRAMYTVLLHGFQLLLCVLALTYPFTASLVDAHGWGAQDVEFFNYFTFMLIPRFLSPLIYGFRDQSLRASLAKTLRCCSSRASPKPWKRRLRFMTRDSTL